MALYKISKATAVKRGSRAVLWAETHKRIIFRCPCDGRLIAIEQPPHTITVEHNRTITLDGSVGSHARFDRPANWCHFWLKQGRVEMVSDARCPGAGHKEGRPPG